MATIQSQIELFDAFTAPMMTIINAVNMGIGTLEDMQQTMNESFDPSGIQSMRDYLDQAAVAVTELESRYENMEPSVHQNVDEQDRFNRELQEGVDLAGNLKGMIAGAVGAYVGMAGIRKATSFIRNCTELYDTQLNAETQLRSVLANTLDAEYVAQFELEVSADTTGAIADLAAIQSDVPEVVVPVSAETRALNAAFDTITEKASEIQSRGIYGDEAMIAAAAEFSTYFTDTDAITMMMDTLADYAMGMSGGGEIDSTAMVNYATNLGKIMSGAYDAMTQKGFEFSDAQKAIIEGEATQEQIVAVLGAEYADMSKDMQAAAAITQVIDESWAGLYETMSNTPQGKMIRLNNAVGDLQETVGEKLYPYIILIIDEVQENWPTIEGIVSGITVVLSFAIRILSWMIDKAFAFAQTVKNNWSWIEPIVLGIVGGLIAYKTWLLLATAAEIASKIAKGLMTTATNAQTAATEAQTAAQVGLNTAMSACPTTLIILGIMALIAVLIALWDKCEGFREFWADMWRKSADSFLGTYNNVVVPVGNKMMEIHEKIMGVVCNFSRTGINAYYDLATGISNSIATVMEKMSWLIDLYNQITSVTGGPTISVDLFTANTERLEKEREKTLAALEAYEAMFAHTTRFQIQELDEDAFNAAADDMAEKIKNFTVTGWLKEQWQAIQDVLNSGDDDSWRKEIEDELEKVLDDLDNINDGLDLSNEDLKYLRDIAEQEAINRFTTAEITIEQTNHNNVSGKMDLDGVVSGLTDAVNEAVDIITEGVHA